MVDVCVVGAGVGGLALAHGLVADRHEVRVLERADWSGTDGAGVTIFSNGTAALAQLGVTLDGVGGVIETLRLRRSDGRPLMQFDLGLLHRRTGHDVRTVPRSELIDRLRSGLPPDSVRYACPVQTVRADGQKAAVVLPSGEQQMASVVVGADGYRSVVRRDVVDPAAAADSGWATWQGLTKVLPEIGGGTTGLLLVGDAGLVGMMPAGHGLVQWWFDTPWSRTAPAEPSPADWLRSTFGTYADPVPALLAVLDDADIGRYPHVVHRVLDRWGSGPITLLGDAAHAFPPSQAQGANQALEDAWVLRRALRTADDPATSLRRYERRRIPHVRLVSRMAASERTNRPPSAILGGLVRLIPASLTDRAYRRLIHRFSSVLNDEQP